MNVNEKIIKRQWKHRNHDVFEPLAKRQIRNAIRKLKGN